MDLTVHNTVLLDIWWNMFIKFDRQIVNTFMKIINSYKGLFKTLSNIQYGALLQVITSIRGKLRMLPDIYDEVFAKIVEN